jgi:hypothetical protein
VTERLRLIIGALSAVVLLSILGYAMGRATRPFAASGVPTRSAMSPTAEASPTRHGVAAAARQTVTVPRSGSGRFAVASGTTVVAGTGILHRYQVAVEIGARVGEADFAAAVQQTLADPRGWTARGRWRFQRVGPGQPHDFVVKLATPATVDRICGAAGIRTSGEVSCRAGADVVINLRRWVLAIPAYAGHERDYQHLVVNHEVGHFLGFGHVGCPGRGRPAPAMMPQYFGLDGCTPNAWPYP